MVRKNPIPIGWLRALLYMLVKLVLVPALMVGVRAQADQLTSWLVARPQLRLLGPCRACGGRAFPAAATLDSGLGLQPACRHPGHASLPAVLLHRWPGCAAGVRARCGAGRLPARVCRWVGSRASCWLARGCMAAAWAGRRLEHAARLRMRVRECRRRRSRSSCTFAAAAFALSKTYNVGEDIAGGGGCTRGCGCMHGWQARLCGAGLASGVGKGTPAHSCFRSAASPSTWRL